MSDEKLPGEGLICFVIGPIGNRLAAVGTPEKSQYETSAQLWESLFEPACARLGLQPLRADKLAEPGEITEQIFLLLRDADVVIADLSGGNPNVMYELGLRHTRDRITVQVGEYGRLPFDINTIRTIQFKRTEAGLVDARESLVDTLTAALGGHTSAVTATRVWTDLAPSPSETVAAAVAQSAATNPDVPEDDDAGFIDVLAEGEAALEQVATTLQEVGEAMEEIGQLTAEAGTRAQTSDQQRGGFAGRLRIAQQLSSDLAQPVARMESEIAEFLALVEQADPAIQYIFDAIESDPAELAQAGDYLGTVIGMAEASEGSTDGVAVMMQGARDMKKIARSLGEPTKVILRSLGQYLQAAALITGWRERAQILRAALLGPAS